MTLMLAQLRSFYVGDKAQLRSAYYVEPAGLAIAPDTLDENLTPTRPTTFREVHRWAGWGVKG